jgi:hypothetical protein
MLAPAHGHTIAYAIESSSEEILAVIRFAAQRSLTIAPSALLLALAALPASLVSAVRALCLEPMQALDDE